MKKGYIHFYYGMGRGKTSILNGSVIRALGSNLNLEYLRFFKNRESAEFIFFKKCGYDFKISSFYKFSTKFIWEMDATEYQIFKKETLEGMEYFKKIIQNPKFDLIIGDELLDVVTNKMLTDAELYEILKLKHPSVEIMLSGHILPKKCATIADLISYIEPKKHYLSNGQIARPGIEY